MAKRSLQKFTAKCPLESRGKSVQQVHPQEVILISGFSQKRKKQDGGRSELDNCGGNRRRKGLISSCPNSFGALSIGDESKAKLQNTGPLLTMHQTSRLVWLVCSLLFALTKLIAGS